jgi:hypothetical protein
MVLKKKVSPFDKSKAKKNPDLQTLLFNAATVGSVLGAGTAGAIYLNSLNKKVEPKVEPKKNKFLQMFSVDELTQCHRDLRTVNNLLISSKKTIIEQQNTIEKLKAGQKTEKSNFLLFSSKKPVQQPISPDTSNIYKQILEKGSQYASSAEALSTLIEILDKDEEEPKKKYKRSKKK